MRGLTISRLGASVCAMVMVLGFGRALVADTIYSNNAAPGDLVNGTAWPGASAAITSSPGWLYNNVRTGGTIGIRTDNPFLGNGSVALSSNGSNAKADVEYFPGVMGKVKDVDAFSYSWYRDSSSSTTNFLTPSYRMYVSNGVKSGYLVWEPTYNEAPGWTAPTDQWVTSDAFNGGNGVFWTTGSLPDAFNKYQSMSAWIADGLGDYNVLGISAGVGSGWSGTYLGALDGLTIGFTGGSATTYNFEVVPEPSSIVLSIVAGGLGLVGLARRRSQRARSV